MSSAPKNPRIFKSRKDSGFRIPEFGFLNLDFNFFDLASLNWVPNSFSRKSTEHYLQ